MSDGMGFGYYTGDGNGNDGTDLNAQQHGDGQGDGQKSGLRQYIGNLEQQNKTLSERLTALEAESKRNRVADQLEAKGYDRGVAALYNGDPDKIDEWLGTAGSFLAKRPDQQQGQGEGQQQTQQSQAGDLAGQAQMQAFHNAGTQAAPPQGSDAEQAAAMAAMNDPQKLTEFLASQGNEFARYYNG